MTTTIRALSKADEAEWRRLWTGYLEFYETSVTEEVYHTTFSRLLGEDAQDYHGLLAEQGGKTIGLTHYLFHRHCWRIENVIYLQDLFVAPEARGTGAGRALIDAGIQCHRAQSIRSGRKNYTVYQVSAPNLNLGALVEPVISEFISDERNYENP